MSKVVTGSAAEPSVRRPQHYEWWVVGSLGLAFVAVSLVDIGLTFYPLSPGSAEWEFGTATAVMGNLPLVVVGLGLVAVAGIGQRSVATIRFARFASALLVLLMVALAVMFGRNVSAALASVSDPLLLEGLKESIVRTTVQLIAYVGALGWIVVKTRGA